MFFRKVVTRRDGKEYVYLKLIENYRQGGKIKQRVIANFGNIEKLTPARIRSIIDGLTRIVEDKTRRPGPQLPPDLLLRFEDAWRVLDIEGFLKQGNGKDTIPGDFADLIKIMALRAIGDTQDNRPIDAFTASLDLPEFKDRRYSGIDFYRALNLLAGLVPGLGRHLYTRLQEFKPGPMVLLLNAPGEFTGHNMGMATSGETHQIRPFSRMLATRLLVHWDGIPVASLPDPDPRTTETTLAGKYGLGDWNLQGLCLVNHQPPYPTGVFYIEGLPVAAYADIPVSDRDPWDVADPTVTDDTLWMRCIDTDESRFILMHDLSPDAPGDQDIEAILAAAAADLEQLLADAKSGRISRLGTLKRKLDGIINQHQCADWVDVEVDDRNRTFKYERREEVIRKEKALRRTQALRTNLREMSPRDIAAAYQRCQTLMSQFKTVHDVTRIPVIHPFSDRHYSEEQVQGQVMIRVLGQAVRAVTNLKPSETTP